MSRLFFLTIFGLVCTISAYCGVFTLPFNNYPGMIPQGGSLEGRVWMDKNKNGIQDPGETGIPGITILLFNQLDFLVDISTSDNSGNYTFNNLNAGSYKLKFPVIQGLRVTSQFGGSSNADSDIDHLGFTQLINVINNQTIRYIDAGYKSDMVVSTNASIQTCLGNSTTLNALVSRGRPPYTFNWSNGLGTGNSKTVSPSTNTTYRVTVTDFWGNQDQASINVRVTAGVGEEQCHVIDNFMNGGSTSSFSMQVNPLDPGPKSVTQSAPIGLLGNTRNVSLEYISGSLPSSININMGTGVFTNSNDVGSRSRTSLCYNNNGTGINFDLSPFDYLKFKNIQIDQGGINIDVNFWDGTRRVVNSFALPESGVGTSNDHILVFADIPELQTMNIEHIQEICMEFTVIEASVDFQLVSLMACRNTDCGLELGEDLEICRGETVELEADVPCAQNLIYRWDNGLPFQSKHSVTPLQTTVYNVTVMDANGCSVNGSIEVKVNNKPDVSLGPDLEICKNQTFDLIPKIIGGSQPFEYLWNTGSDLQTLNDLVALENNLYSVTVTDANSCVDSALIQIITLENPIITFTTNPANCQTATGSATAFPSGGQPPYTYIWSNGDADQNLNDVTAGFYNLTVTDSKGCMSTGQVFVNESFCAKIGDYVWHDMNADGIQNPGEPGIPGVRVDLLDQSQQLISFTLTNENGYYMFSALSSGDYYIRFILPADYHYSPANQGVDPMKDSNANPMTGLSSLVSLSNFEEDLSIDAGLYKFARIGDYVWLDTNGNGIQNSGETGISGIVVSLLDCNGSIVNTTTTDENGFYSFSNLLPGQYKVRFIAPAGMKFITPNQGTDPTADSDVAVISGETSCLTLVSNQVNLTIDAGLYMPAKIGDKVWIDLNADGQQSVDEPGLANFEVRLLDCNGTVLKNALTNAQGNYLFEDLIPGSYKIGVNSLAGYELSPYHAGNPDTDSNIDPATNTSECEILLSGESNLTYDIGLFHRAAIGDFVWVDSNGNGIQDTGENGFPGMLVQLYHCDNNLVAQTTSNASGYYNFGNLLPGNYSIKFNLGTGWFFSQPGMGSNAAFDSNADQNTGWTGCETLISGEVNNSYDAGVYQRGKVGDYVWEDLNGNGLQDAGEPGVFNFKVLLKTCNGTLVQTKYTDQYGYYLFDNIIPGQYLLDFSQNAEPYFTLKNQGTNTSIDSDVNQITGQTSCFAVTSGSVNYTIDAGLLKVASVGDFVWEDINGNGIQEDGEPGVEGIQAKLYRVNSGGTVFIGDAYTNESGYYIFQNIAPGTYYIKYILGGTNWQVTVPNVNNDFIDSDVTHANGFNSTSNFVLLPGQHNPDVDAGLYICAEVGDLVWCDFTPNHYWQTGENGINGVEVELYRKMEDTWVFWTSVITEYHNGSMPGDGFWSACVIPGEYYAKYNLPENSNFLLVDPFIGGNPEYDSDVTNAFGHGTTDAFILQSGDVKTDLGAGYYYGGIIGDRVWYDLNQNGLQDTGEPSASGILVEVFGVEGKIADDITDSNGNYTIDNLIPGDYYLKFSPGGYQFTTPNIGSNDHIDSDVTNANGPGTTNWFNLEVHEINYSFDAGLINTNGRMIWNGQGGSYRGDHNEIWWETRNEEQIELFELHRMDPGSDQFDLLDIIQAKGGRDLIQSYDVEDFEVEKTGLYKYRIMSRDLFSNSSFSPEILINVIGEMKMVLYPNPATELINFGFYNRNVDEISIQLFNNLGILVKSYPNIMLDKNMVFYREITLDDLPAGNYHIKISGKDLNWTANISVMR
ncbi:MAG TPA: hypothetical protein DCX89_01165 [Saprospirales bacterium]|nr:hypothetical protein [Saprospirales bacterium]HAY70476.1 hypothetical protein [Saprospirales bacterium]HRQ29112.1 SdrD B-like domain-containing protein [Saprospiraceae bacterium]